MNAEVRLVAEYDQRLADIRQRVSQLTREQVALMFLEMIQLDREMFDARQKDEVRLDEQIRITAIIEADTGMFRGICQLAILKLMELTHDGISQLQGNEEETND